MTEQARVKKVFIESLDVSDAERAGYLDQACGGDTELRAEVESLLAALACRPVFDTGSQPTVTPIVPGSALAEGPGTQIGSYKLYDRFAKDKGFRDQSLGPAALTVIDPYLPPNHPDRCKVFWSPEVGARYLEMLRASYNPPHFKK